MSAGPDWDSLRRRFVDSPGSLGERSRVRRWQALLRLFPTLERLNVIDLGGTVTSWERSPVRPRRVLVVNLVAQEPSVDGVVSSEQADACDLPERLFGAGWDLAFSNSLIEHVGGHARRRQLADTIHRLAPRHWVQAPYRYFPVEPHWLFPGLQFLPLALRARALQAWPLTHARNREFHNALAAVANVELPSKTEMRHYFPDSTLLRDTVGFVTKSLVAVRGSEALDAGGGRSRRLRDYADAR